MPPLASKHTLVSDFNGAGLFGCSHGKDSAASAMMVSIRCGFRPGCKCAWDADRAWWLLITFVTRWEAHQAYWAQMLTNQDKKDPG